MSRPQSIPTDLLGIIASAACALHCSALPILLAMGSLSGMAWMEQEWVEVLFLLSAMIFAGWAIVPRFLQDRSVYIPVVLMTIGLVLLMIGAVQHTHNGEVRILSVIGGAALIAAHYANYRQSPQTCRITA